MLKNSHSLKTCAVGTKQHEIKKIRALLKLTLITYHDQCLCLFATCQAANHYQNTCHMGLIIRKPVFMANCIYLHNTLQPYITKFDFMNYLLSNLEVKSEYFHLRFTSSSCMTSGTGSTSHLTVRGQLTSGTKSEIICTLGITCGIHTFIIRSRVWE